MTAVEEVWYGDGLAPMAARFALRPFAAAYGMVVRIRSALYDAEMFESETPPLPTITVGNLTVGGTGKTPVSAWLASRLSARARTAVALRGYGTDEIEVHARLNPRVPVVVNADRLAAVRDARSRGAEVVVLDDAFQHRRLRATASMVLVSVEQLDRPRRLLPAGPWRESLDSARRADLIVVTRKSASRERAASAVGELTAALPVPTAQVHLAPEALRRLSDDQSAPLERLAGTPVLAIAAIGEPESFLRQLVALGADVTMASFRDHHEFTDTEMASLVRRAPPNGLVICTLKDAVKLSPRWAGSAPLWYLSQQLVVERGEAEIIRLLERVLDARHPATTFAG